MDLFKLLGTIAVNNTEAIDALKQTTNEAKKTADSLGDTSKSGEKSSSKLGTALGKIGKGAAAVGKAVGAGMVAAGTAVAGLASAAVASYASYEQLVGGVQTLFGAGGKTLEEYAASVGKTVDECREEYDSLMKAESLVMANAEKAFATAGLSANDYMETVTSFSASLIQSLEGDTVAAAEKANMALVDMSDNANKMGTDMSMIQNAYQGFAKKNFSMLDNLKLGYGGTQEEMYRLMQDAAKLDSTFADNAVFSLDSKGHLEAEFADIVDAIHIVQTEMGITGTTSAEAAGTISGSMSSVKAAWSNVVTALASDELPFDKYVDVFVQSASTMLTNFLPRIKTALQGVVKLVDSLAPIIIAELPGLFESLLPPIITAATGLISSLVTIFPQLVSVLVGVLPSLIDGVVQIVNGLIAALPTIMQAIVGALPTLLPDLVNGIVSMIVTLCTMLPQIIQPIIDNLPEIITSIVTALLDSLPALIEGLIALLNGVIAALPQIIEALLGALPTVITSIINALIENVPMLVDGFITLFQAFQEAIPQITVMIWEALPEIISALVDGFAEMHPKMLESGLMLIVGIFSGFMSGLSHVGEVLSAAFHGIVDGIKALFGIHSPSTVMAEIGGFIVQGLIEGIRAMFGAVSQLWNSIKTTAVSVFNALKSTLSSIMNGIKTTVSNVWNGIKTTVSNVVNSVKTTVSNVFNSVKTTVSNVFSGIKDTATTTWNNIKSAITKPIEDAKEKVSSVIEKIKGLFNFEFKLPDIKTPKFSIQPDGWKIGDLLEGSIPKLGISWNAAAMNNPLIMTKPTIFGYNGATGELLGGGEAGSEVVSGTGTLMRMIRASVAGEIGAMQYYLEKILAVLADYFPQFLEALAMELRMDSGELVGVLAAPMNKKLGELQDKEKRGR